MTKLSKKRVQVESDVKNVKPKVFKNGLWEDINLYRNLKVQFTLCKKNGLVLSNKSFDDLNPQQTKFSRKTKNEFITICCSETGWALLIINHKEKSFGFINQHLLSAHIAEKFMSTLQAENYIDMDLQGLPSNDFNSGIYIYKCIVASSATGGATIPEDFCADTYRIELQKKVIEESDNVTDYCPICNLSDVKGMRWSHCCCIEVDLNQVQKDKHFKCPICTLLEF